MDQAGRALFQPRETTLRVAPYTDREIERELYEAVTEYVRSGWDAAKRQRRRSAGFLVLLMQRLMASSTAAILAALEKRSAALGERGAQLALFVDRDEDWADLTGEEQYRALTEARGPAWETEPIAGTSRPERIAGLVEVAAEAKKALGRPVDDPLDALAALPEMAPGEPCPVIRVPEAQAGWLSIWEVTPDGAARGATAVFQPDEGLVRPDLSVTLWDRCYSGVPLADHRTPDTGTWEGITAAGVDHAYQAVARLAGESEMTLPGAQLRLLVRVEP